MEMKMKPEGIIPAVITPFTLNGELDVDGLRRTINFLIKNGVHGVMVCGSTGEAANLSIKEHKKVIETTVNETACIKNFFKELEIAVKLKIKRQLYLLTGNNIGKCIEGYARKK